MKTFFLNFKAAPVTGNEHFGKIEAALANFWVLEKSAENSIVRAKHHLSEYGWKPLELEQYPVEVTAAQFAQKDIGSANYKKAQLFGIALVLEGWPEKPQGPD